MDVYDRYQSGGHFLLLSRFIRCLIVFWILARFFCSGTRIGFSKTTCWIVRNRSICSKRCSRPNGAIHKNADRRASKEIGKLRLANGSRCWPVNRHGQGAPKSPAAKGDITAERQTGQPVKQHRQRDLGDQAARRPCTGTKMRTRAKSNCTGAVLAQIILVGGVKCGRVAVTRSKHKKYPCVSRQGDIPNGIVLGDPAW